MDKSGWLTALFIAAALILAFGESCDHLVGRDYDAQVAVLTATLIAVALYTKYTYDTLQYNRQRDTEMRERERRNLATALLAELKWLDAGLRQLVLMPPGQVPANDVLVSPVFDEAMSRLASFEPETCTAVTEFYAHLLDLRKKVQSLQLIPASARKRVVPALAAQARLLDWRVPDLTRALVNEGGVLPPYREEIAYTHEAPKLPNSPFGEFSPERGWLPLSDAGREDAHD